MPCSSDRSDACDERAENPRVGLFLEYEEVLKRPDQRLVTGLSEEDVTGFLAAFAPAWTASDAPSGHVGRPQANRPQAVPTRRPKPPQ